MARVNYVKRARKDIIGSDGKVLVAKGESYYYWTLGFRGRKQVSKTYPAKRQLTQSEHLHRVYDFEDAVENMSSIESPGELQSAIENLISDVEEYKSELEDRLSNMPTSLQDSSVLNERIEALGCAISDLESIELDFEEPTESDAWEGCFTSWLDEKLQEIQAIPFE